MKGVYIIMSNIADKFEELGVIPVVVLNDAKDALPLAKALVEGGLPCAEVTFRTAAAEESIRLMHEAYPDMVLAAGTVLTTEQVDRAVAAGASVIVAQDLIQKSLITVFLRTFLLCQVSLHLQSLLRLLREALQELNSSQLQLQVELR